MSTANIDKLMTRAVVTVTPSQTVAEAEAALKRGAFRHLAVVDEGKLVGVLSERDMVTAGPGAKVAQVMTADPVTVTPDAPAQEAVVAMLQHRFSSLPVVDDGGGLVGIVTSTDVMMVAFEALSDGQADAPSPEKRIRVEHAALRGKLERVQSADYPDSAAVALMELRRFLVRHFAREEAEGGLFDQLVSADPALADDVDALRQQHRSVLGRLEHVEIENRRLAASGFVDVGPGIGDLVADLERHEADEAALYATSLERAKSSA